VFSLAAFGGLYMCFAVLGGWWPARRLSSAAAASTLIAGERREGAFELTGPGGVPGLLPRDRDSFTGRQHELQELAGAVAGSGGVVGIYAIGGMAGVGKTAFAVHTAHRLAGRFPDGQIFLALHGHTPGREPVDPGDALASLLLMVGVAAAQIPPGVEIRAALWRGWLASRRLLLVLDDAASSEQVLPLLPGSGGSLVLVTSRRRLSALEDARTISLDTLPPGEAADLLVQLAGRPGLSAADPGVGELTRLCGYLPLAIGIAARHLHHHPAWTPAGWAAELADARDRPELMETENLSVAAAFNLSYEDLTGDQQRLFRRLGLHPGADVDGYAAAALDGTGVAAARRGLEGLYGQYLLEELARGRFRMHNLIREHARALGEDVDPDGDRDQATARLLDYYQHASARAEALLALPGSPAPVPASGPMPAEVPAFADREQALAWARAERANVLACLDQVTRTGPFARIIALTAGTAAVLRYDGPWAEAITRHTTALRSARHLGDRPGQAGALNNLGIVRELTGDYPAATRDLNEALGIYRELGDRRGQAGALTSLGNVRRLTDQFPAAARDLEEALGICRDLGDRRGQAYALIFLGDVRRITGDYPEAARDLEEALGICRDLGDRSGQAYALNFLGIVRKLTGDYPEAARDLEESLATYLDVGERRGQAGALLFLGIVRRVTGDYQGAARALEESLSICGDIGYRGAEVEALNEFGTLCRVGGDLPRAGSCHQRALDLARQIDSSWDEAHALAGLGRCALAAGHKAEAQDRLRRALEIFQRIGAVETAGVSAELKALTKA
jgi:tetratricopeptide (TPR) repeat protein